MSSAATEQGPVVLDIRFVPPPERHPLIFQCCAELAVGDWLLLVNDHDPQPLRRQLQALHPGQFGWEYLEQGPEVWQVRIPRLAAAAPDPGGCTCSH